VKKRHNIHLLRENSLDPDEDSVHVPLIAWSRPAAAQAIRETRGEFLAPASDRLAGHN
jgi:hypothetical protein